MSVRNDRGFWSAVDALRRAIAAHRWQDRYEGPRPTAEEVELAARELGAWAQKTGDKFVVSTLAALVEEHATGGLALPATLAAAVAGLLRRPPKRARGRRAGVADRALQETHAMLIRWRLGEGDTLEQACQWVEDHSAAPGPKSVRTLKRRWRLEAK